jgi:hypothetical protein
MSTKVAVRLQMVNYTTEGANEGSRLSIHIDNEQLPVLYLIIVCVYMIFRYVLSIAYTKCNTKILMEYNFCHYFYNWTTSIDKSLCGVY